MNISDSICGIQILYFWPIEARQWPKLQLSQSAEAEQSATVKFWIWPTTEAEAKAEADYWILKIYKVHLTKLYLICRFMQLN